METAITRTATATNSQESYEPTVRSSNTVTNEIDPNQLLAKKSCALIFAVAVACIGSSFIFGYTIGATNVPEKVSCFT
uniref:Uncharacterized protein n=1 Tax=Panagrolaimus sp. JU765 TaxID=591449 RepID=A0AC34RG82_9BILA